MPDDYGRPTYDDWAGIANAIGSINKTIQSGRDNAIANQERQKAKQYESDVDYNAGLYKDGAVALDEGSPYASENEAREAAMRGTAKAKTEAKQITAMNMTADQTINSMKIDADVLQRENQLWQKYSQLPAEQRDAFLDNYVPQSKADHQGFITFVSALDKNADFKKKRVERNIQKGQQRFKDWSTKLQTGNGYLQQGNVQLAEQYIELAINGDDNQQIDGVHHPLFIQKNQNGTYDLIYKEMGKESLVGDDITLEQAYQKAFSIPAKDFVADYVAQKQMITKMNRDAGFTEWSNGKSSYDVTTVYKPSNPKVGVAVVYEKAGGVVLKKDGSPMTIDDLKSQGFRPKDLDKEIKQQQIETSKASMRSHDRANQPDPVAASTKMTKKYKQDLAFVLTPFVKSGTDNSFMFDKSGALSQKGEGALQAAMTFVENNPDPSKLSELEQIKWQKGKEAIQLYNGMSQNIVNNYIQTPEGKKQGLDTPPIKGAKKAKDGIWYVQSENGQWNEVVDEPDPEVGYFDGVVGQPNNEPMSPEDATAIDINPGQAMTTSLPENMNEWDVTMVRKGSVSVPVVILDNGQQIELTQAQYDQWRQSAGNSGAGKDDVMQALSTLNSHRTDKDLRPKTNPFIRQ